MSNVDQDNYEQQYGADMPEQQSGGRGFNWLLGCGIGCGVMVLICCGGAFILGYQAYRVALDSFTEEPEEILAISDNIATFNRPESFKPALGAKIDFSLFGQSIIVDGAMYEVGEDGLFVLSEFGEAFTGNDVEYLQQQLSDAIEQQRQDTQSSIVFEGEPQEVPITIRGQENTFQFTRGKDTKDDREYIQVLGSFPGNEGPAVVWGILPLDEFDEQATTELIKSIQ